jgi:hypothetical protein
VGGGARTSASIGGLLFFILPLISSVFICVYLRLNILVLDLSAAICGWIIPGPSWRPWRLGG